MVVGPLVVLALALATAACGRGGDGGDGGGGDGRSASAADRRPMPACGAYDAPLGEITPEQRVIRDCFLAAFAAGREAEVTITVTSIEGDPLTTIYRVLGPADVELFVDASADRFAEVPTYRQRCTSVAEAGSGLVADGCTTTG